MRTPLLALGAVCALHALFTLAGCAPPAAHAPSAALTANCDKVETTTAAFTAPDAADIVETRAIGADCRTAAVVIVVRRATGEPLWAWASAHAWLDEHVPDGPADPSASIDGFLKGWRAKIDTTTALPDWPERDVFKDSLGAFMRTPYDRDQYLDIRSKGFARLCHATGVESGLCIYYDPSKGAVFEVLQTGA